MSDQATGGLWGRSSPRAVMLAGVLAWLWPIGLGGRMPVGGDATQFSMGLMGFLRSSIRVGRLPLWNDLWGFGFPGVAESQMGVFYPPHLLLYGALPTEVAYTLSLVLHTVWGALGAAWAARRLGTSEAGAGVAGFAWATSGFFLIHLPHQWAYTVGSWMPWAWGLAWMVARGEGSRRTPWTLAAVLALQVLPGHFQLAFVTEVGALVLVLSSGRGAVRRSILVAMAVAGMVPMAAMQLGPTFELARLSGSRRDFEYLSGFAATPLHLISYVAPGLFHRSPLWRPVAWDPFHTSPEEHLGYVGLVPLFLALRAIRRGWRGEDSGVRALTVVAAVSLLLSLGPYLIGFESLIRLPGFSFFRAPARWGLATALALSLLAGRGFDAWRSWPRTGRSLARFSGLAALAILTVVAGFELAMASGRGGAWPMASAGFNRALKALPWGDRPGEPSFLKVIAGANRPQSDLRAQSSLARLEKRLPPPPGPTLAGERFAIYRLELGESGVLLVALAAASSLAARRPRSFAAALVVVTALDGLLMSRHRPIDLGPTRPLVEQSPVLARIAAGPRGVRTLDPAQNLFMIAGAAPIAAYRTLDLPSPGGLIAMAGQPSSDPRVAEALRVAGVGVRVVDPFQGRDAAIQLPEGWASEPETIADPSMAGWLYGVDLASATGARDFTIGRPSVAPSRAWLASSKAIEGVDGMSDPMALLASLRGAIPLPWRADSPERAEVEVRVASSVPSTVVLSQTFDPEWRAAWSGPSGERRPAKVVRVLGGWQGVEVPEPGRWTLHLEYPGRAVWLGLTISSLAWSVWGVVYLRMRTGDDLGGVIE